ncbi:TBC1 domain family member 20 [Strongylocentrotus purpuratus]|uniref:TBC1 domain family member 20 n=1 Tax=Strongylocentrotus purpuratus TaxID=7668 RepID=A0A7M7GH74_STRPU|nr:TBC1 domain family member 20 [Strongylocentrotus purpuratus]|eukprot:XP_003727013.1 PREDICTED: TBC1 domain family member 20 [Strongylocentrotus purpuratus]
MSAKRRQRTPNGKKTPVTTDLNATYTPPPTAAKSPQGPESAKKAKLTAIYAALNSDPVDVAALRKLAISRGGLLTDEIRRKAWPKLLNVNVFDPPPKLKMPIEEHRDYNQVVLDVNRSLKRFPPGMQDEQREVLQDQLVDVIVRVLINNDQLHYYQGYHDIVVTFLLVVGKEKSFSLVDKLSTHHLRDFMDRTMDRTKHMLNYLLPIIRKANPKLHDFMERSEVGYVFALAWLITWYGHVLNDFHSILRLYDFFLACHPLMPVYLAAAIVLEREADVLAVECDMAFVHSLLSRIPDNLPMEELVIKAGDLFVQYPPHEMAKEAQLQYNKSSAITKHKELEGNLRGQRPDTVLRRLQGQAGGQAQAGSKQSNRVVKVAVWAISAGIGAAALAVLNSAMEFWV